MDSTKRLLGDFFVRGVVPGHNYRDENFRSQHRQKVDSITSDLWLFDRVHYRSLFSPLPNSRGDVSPLFSSLAYFLSFTLMRDGIDSF